MVWPPPMGKGRSSYACERSSSDTNSCRGTAVMAASTPLSAMPRRRNCFSIISTHCTAYSFFSSMDNRRIVFLPRAIFQVLFHLREREVTRRRLSMLEKKEYAVQCVEMIEKQLRRRGIADSGVLAAMTAVPRHEFVSEELRSHAYDDLPLPIGGGQTISQPYIVAAMTAALHLQPDDRVLEIGTGCGYQAAVISRLAKEVFTIERRPELASSASVKLTRL